MKKYLDSEVISAKLEKVVTDSAIIETNESVVATMKNGIEKFSMAHGSHNQHSSSSTY